MTKKPTEARRKLVLAARELLPERGVAGLKVREVARRAGVNLGLFHYHFKSKDAFMRTVLQELYEEFFARFGMETGRDKDPLKRLRAALLELARFMRDNRRLTFMLIRESLEGNRLTIDYARQNIPRHGGLVIGLVVECQARGKLRKVPLPVAMSFLMGNISMPNLIVSAVERAKVDRPWGKPFSEFEAAFISDEAIELRIDLALRGLKP